MKMNNRFVLTVVLMGVSFFNCRGDDVELKKFLFSGNENNIELVRGLIDHALSSDESTFDSLEHLKRFYNGLKEGAFLSSYEALSRGQDWDASSKEMTQTVMQTVRNILLFYAVRVGSFKLLQGVIL